MFFNVKKHLQLIYDTWGTEIYYSETHAMHPFKKRKKFCFCDHFDINIRRGKSRILPFVQNKKKKTLPKPTLFYHKPAYLLGAKIKLCYVLDLEVRDIFPSPHHVLSFLPTVESHLLVARKHMDYSIAN